jgi:predicted ribosomally synthesized peptide with nif11-like leader
MKKFKMSELTPAIMKDLINLKSPEEFLNYAKENGYDLSLEEAEKLFKQFSETSKSVELSDEEIDKVAGGADCEGQKFDYVSTDPKAKKSWHELRKSDIFDN